MAENIPSDKISNEEINNLLLAAQQLEKQATRYNQQIEILNSYYNEIQKSEQILVELKGAKEDQQMLLPIGAGNFIYTSIKNAEKVIQLLTDLSKEYKAALVIVTHDARIKEKFINKITMV